MRYHLPFDTVEIAVELEGFFCLSFGPAGLGIPDR